MSLETATYVGDLVTTNPTATDPKSQGDDHLRLLKTVLQATFAGFAGPILAAGIEAQGATINDYVLTISPAPATYVNRMIVVGKATHTNAGAATLKINALAAVTFVGIDGAALSPGDLEAGAWFAAMYDGAVPAMVLLSGNDRGARDGDTWTGVHDFTGATIVAGPVTATSLAVSGSATGITPATGDATTKLATTEFVRNTSFTTNLPGQLNNGGRELVTDGINASWEPRFHLPLLPLGIV